MNKSIGHLVSIIMPSYNSEKYMGLTIESVISQTYENWELIVVDDCSNDGTRSIVEKYVENDGRISLLALRRNNGAPAAPRNIGVNKAAANWIALLDSDDIWHPSKLEYQMKALKNTKAKFCSTRMIDFFDDKKILFGIPKDIAIEQISFSKQLRRYRTPTSSVVLEKKLLILNPFNEDLRYKAREDFDCWLRIHESIDYSIKLSFPFLYYRVVPGQISGSKFSMIKRTLLVLGEYKLKSGEFLGWRKYLYLFTHIVYSIYFRVIRKTL